MVDVVSHMMLMNVQMTTSMISDANTHLFRTFSNDENLYRIGFRFSISFVSGPVANTTA